MVAQRSHARLTTYDDHSWVLDKQPAWKIDSLHVTYQWIGLSSKKISALVRCCDAKWRCAASNTYRKNASAARPDMTQSFSQTTQIDSIKLALMGDVWVTLVRSDYVCPTFAVCKRVSQWASCQIRKTAGAHAPGMPGTFSPSPQVSYPDMHHGTCVTDVPRCMLGSLTSGFLWSRRWGETFPAFPPHAQPTILRIW